MIVLKYRPKLVKLLFVDAMKIQIELDFKGGDHRLIDEMLIDIGYMDASELDEVLKTMSSNI